MLAADAELDVRARAAAALDADRTSSPTPS